ncbi:MAG TPA: geranylgeranyl reductase family protein [Actinomycetota bacterium]
MKDFTSGGGQPLDPSNAHTETDVLIVGAGPAGATAAYHLARHGIDVTLLDKASFPREKVCGDGLTPRAVVQLQKMGVDLEDPRFERHQGLRIYSRKTVLELPWPTLEDFPGYGLTMTRSSFDELLVRAAEKAGAGLRERTEALGPTLERGWVTGARVRDLDRDEPTEIRARFVIAADGASSRFAAQAGVRRDDSKPLGIAARRYHRIDRHPGPWLEVWMDLWEGDELMPGYGWLFAMADGSVNLGAGLLNTFRSFKDVSAQRVFDAFWRMLPPEWNVTEETAEGRVLSGPLPMGMSRVPASLPGMLVVGDAAGLVNPFNGEGIAYAMESAELAAELIHEALVKGRPGLAHVYPTILRERYARYYRIGTNFVRAIGHPTVMRTLTEYGLPQEWLMRFAMRVMGNLTDGRDGDFQDKLMYGLQRLARAS